MSENRVIITANRGNRGFTGETGATGPKGEDGAEGAVGASGPTGPRGFTGERGATGAKGDKGDTGAAGPAGPVGSDGARGLKGDAGIAGPKGDTGSAGPKGDDGDAGPRGDAGPSGIQGPVGDDGPRGAIGPKGDKGDKGDTGLTGPTGATGSQGDTGPQGATGDTGPAPWTLVGVYDNGVDYGLGDAVTYEGGFYYRTGNPNNTGYAPVPGSITESWTPVADRGATGATGETGPTGATGPEGPVAISAATSPATYDLATKTIGVNQSAIAIAASQVTGTAVITTDSRLSDARTPTAHSHAIADTTGLQTALDGKAATSHTHNNSQIVTTVSDKAANYTIVAADENTVIRSTGGAITITLANVLNVGERIDFIQSGAGQITFAASGVTLNSADAMLKTAKQHAGATVICVASGVYALIGNLG